MIAYNYVIASASIFLMGEENMGYESILKLLTYMASLAAVMMGLNCIQFEKFIRKNKVSQFYLLYVTLTMALTYLVANCFMDFISIRFR